MKNLKSVVLILFILMLSVISFYSFNLLFSFISNYASLSLTSFSFIPMFMFMLICIIFLFGIFNFVVYKRKDAYFIRKYSLIIGTMALVGFIFSIVCGTAVYHTFFGDYVFNAYPFLMLIVHGVLLGISTYYALVSIKTIVKDKPLNSFKTPRFYGVREFALGMILTFALERLGAFVLMPVYFSKVDGIYVLPYLFQLLIPTLIFSTFMIHEHWLHNRKVTIVLSSVAFGYTVFSLVYMLIMSHNRYPLTINPLSAVQQLERLTTLPVDAILLYGISLLIPGLNLTNNIIMTIKEKKKNKSF